MTLPCGGQARLLPGSRHGQHKRLIGQNIAFEGERLQAFDSTGVNVEFDGGNHCSLLLHEESVPVPSGQ